MTTVEEAMVRLELQWGDNGRNSADLATIRKHIEDLRGVTIDQDSKIDVQTHQLSDLMDANIYQQGRIEGLETDLAEQADTSGRALLFIRNAGFNGCDASDARAFFLHPPEPETG